MAGGYYTALSGMRTRQDALDRLASDIANTSTAGYKAERAGTVQADRPSFDTALQSAVDVTNGPARLNLHPGSLASTGRSLDLAIDGPGFFVVDSQTGPRYTRNGHMVRRADGVLAVASDKAIVEKMTATGQIVSPGDSTDFAKSIEQQRAQVAAVAKLFGNKPVQ